ncbi:MAG TPA: DUF1015 domain-containing protein [Acidimicrobiales bacterium]|nr:DUF1015 domain-containing protein [Acidimicrobiales bacterium]
MASFQPFPALRYDPARVTLADVVAPPYDVIDDVQRAELAARAEHNAVRIDLPVDEGGVDRYEVARRLLAAWQQQGVLLADDRPTFTVYRMTYVDDAGRDRHTTGVIGALELTPPGTDILPHEHTTPKAKSDRLDMLRATRANLSAIWGLSLAKGLTDLLPVDGEPAGDMVDDDGVRHTVWVVEDPDRCAAIAEGVATQPVVIADGHHRYETSLAYRGERESAEGEAREAAATLAYLVELVEEELTVRAIHRLLSDLPDGLDLPEALAPWFELVGPPPAGVPVTAAMEEAGALALITPAGEVLLRPRPEALAQARDLDSARLDVALAALGRHTLWFQHGVDNVRRAVSSGDAQAGVLLRPATVAQIEATAHGGERMPPKTTFFHPKLKTGLVFRRLG